MTVTCGRPHSQRRLQPGSLKQALPWEVAEAKFSTHRVPGCCSASPQCPLARRVLIWTGCLGTFEFLLRWYVQARCPSWTGMGLYLIMGFQGRHTPNPSGTCLWPLHPPSRAT